MYYFWCLYPCFLGQGTQLKHYFLAAMLNFHYIGAHNKKMGDLFRSKCRPEGDASRATAVHILDASVLPYLPTDNLDCERDLAKFDKLAQRFAACSNKKFTSKCIRDEITLYKQGVQ